MPKRQILITEETDGGFHYSEKGLTVDSKTQQVMEYNRDGVKETEEGLLKFMEAWLGVEKKK